MSRIVTLLCTAGLLALGACRSTPPPELVERADVVLEEEARWRSAAAPADVDRIDRLAETWDEALSAAHRAGHGRLIAREGALLEPGAALAIPAPTPGSYLCRLLRFAPGRRRGPVLTAYRPFFCHVGVDGESLTLVKQTGSERPAGHLWVDTDPRRLILLGSLSQGPDEEPVAYGEDPDRDMIATLERIDDFRFRLVAPWPRTGAILDVLELVPVGMEIE